MRKRLVIALMVSLLLSGAAGCGSGQAQTAVTTGLDPVKPLEGFTVVLLPDTQCYPSNGATYMPGACGSSPDGDISMMRAQTDWTVAHRTDFKIAAVIGLGDIVNDAHRDNEWQAADGPYKTLDDADIPHVAAIGNHDYDTTGGSLSTRLTTKYNQHFGISRFAQRPWYGTSTYPTGGNENSYITFGVGGDRYLVLSLELFPRTAALQWAAGIIEANPDRQVIVVTHAYLGPNASRTSSSPAGYGLSDGNDGEAVWTKLISKYPNIIAVVNGHDAPATGRVGASRRVDQGDSGNSVVQMFSNYQYMNGGGSGYLRLLNIQPAKRKLVIQTYSPYLASSLTDSDNSFGVSY